MANEAGSGAVSRGNVAAGYTFVSKCAPASIAGNVTKLAAFVGSGSGTTAYFAFFTASGNDLTLIAGTRISVTVPAQEAQATEWNAPGDFTAFAVPLGSYLGMYNPGDLTYNTSGSTGLWYKLGDHTEVSGITFGLFANGIDGLSADIEASGGTDELTATEIAIGAPTLETPIIGQTHILTASEIATGAPTLATPTIGQTHELTAIEIATGAPTIETSSCGTTGTNALDATEIATGAPTLAVPTIGQTHGLLAADLYAGQPALDTATLAQIHALVASAIITGSPELGTPTIDAGIHQELVLVTGEFTQLETVTGAFTQLETVSGAFTQTVTVSGKLLKED